jgi:hypothetical protein
VHAVEDAALDRLQAVAGVREGPGVDDRVGVLEEAGPHLVADVDVDDVFFELLGRWCCTTGHAAIVPTGQGLSGAGHAVGV